LHRQPGKFWIPTNQNAISEEEWQPERNIFIVMHRHKKRYRQTAAMAVVCFFEIYLAVMRGA
jgi:hypothetical protein